MHTAVLQVSQGASTEGGHSFSEEEQNFSLLYFVTITMDNAPRYAACSSAMILLYFERRVWGCMQRIMAASYST